MKKKKRSFNDFKLFLYVLPGLILVFLFHYLLRLIKDKDMKIITTFV